MIVMKALEDVYREVHGKKDGLVNLAQLAEAVGSFAVNVGIPQRAIKKYKVS